MFAKCDPPLPSRTLEARPLGHVSSHQWPGHATHMLRHSRLKTRAGRAALSSQRRHIDVISGPDDHRTSSQKKGLNRLIRPCRSLSTLRLFARRGMRERLHCLQPFPWEQVSLCTSTIGLAAVFGLVTLVYHSAIFSEGQRSGQRVDHARVAASPCPLPMLPGTIVS